MNLSVALLSNPLLFTHSTAPSNSPIRCWSHRVLCNLKHGCALRRLRRQCRLRTQNPSLGLHYWRHERNSRTSQDTCYCHWQAPSGKQRRYRPGEFAPSCQTLQLVYLILCLGQSALWSCRLLLGNESGSGKRSVVRSPEAVRPGLATPQAG